MACCLLVARKPEPRFTNSLVEKPRKCSPWKWVAIIPLVVAKVKNAKAAVYNIIQSAFISAGQRCTCARRLILLRSAENEEILALLKTATKNIKVGVSDDCFIGPVVSNAAAENVMQVAARTMSLGGSEVLAPQRLDPSKPFIQPGIIDVTDVEKIDDEECFGPLLQVIWVDNLDEAISRC